MTKGVMNENQQPSVQQELERLFPSKRGGGMGGKSRGPHGDGTGESSASTTNDTSTSFATLSTTKLTIAEIWGSNLWRLPVNLPFFFI